MLIRYLWIIDGFDEGQVVVAIVTGWVFMAPTARRQEPIVVPPSQKDLDIRRESEVLDVLGESFPVHGALFETGLDVVRATKVDPVDEEMYRAGIRHGEEDDRVRRGRRHRARCVALGKNWR